MLRKLDLFLGGLIYWGSFVFPYITKDIFIILETGEVLALEDWDRYNNEDLLSIEGCNIELRFESCVRWLGMRFFVEPIKDLTTKEMALYSGAYALLTGLDYFEGEEK